MRQGARGWRWMAIGGLAAVAAGAGSLAWTLTTIESDLEARSRELATLRREVLRQQAFLALFRSPETRIVTLGGLAPSPSARGRLWWHREAGGFLAVTGLPPAPEGKTYQLWAIAAGTPRSAGVFGVDPKGSGSLRVSVVPGRVERFAVTLEPAGGLPAPSGPMYLAGRVP